MIKNEKWNGGKILTKRGGYALYNDLIDRKLINGKKNKQNKKGNDTISSDKMWAALNKAFTNAGFATGGIAKIKPVGEDGIAWVRNGEGFVRPEDVQHIRDLMAVTPDLTKLVTSFSNLPNVKPLDKNVTRNVSIDNITFDMPNVTNTTDFTDTIKKPEQQKAFAAAIGDAFNGKKLNINRY